MRRQLLITLTLISLAPLSTTQAARPSNNTPNGTPFVYLNQQIESNSSAIDALQQEVTLNGGTLDALQQQVSLLASDYDSLEQRVADNELSIDDALQQINTLSSSITSLASALHDLERTLGAEINALREDIANFTAQLNTLSAQLSLQATELAAKISELERAITSNSGDISTLSVSVSLMSGKITLTESEISALLVRITSSEQLLNSQQSALDELQARISAIDIEVALLGSSSSNGEALPAQNEIILDDTSASDFSGTELRTLFSAISLNAGDYIFIEGAAPGAVDKFCSADAAGYINGYAAGQVGLVKITNVERWVSRSGAGWSRTPDNFTTNLSLGINGDDSGHGWHVYTPSNTGTNTAFSVGFFPLRDNQLQKNEIHVYGDRGYPTSLRIRVGSRASACGF